MRSIRLLAISLFISMGLAFASMALGSAGALADGGKGVAVQPLTPKPGEVITVNGDALGANSTVEVRVIGTGVDIDLGEVEAEVAEVSIRLALIGSIGAAYAALNHLDKEY